MNREQFIKFIPKPENKDIIIYDNTLIDLIDINVLEEYKKLYPIFINKQEKYNELKSRIDEYTNTINNIYLYKPSWTEKDYLENLQNDKKTYSILYNDIKKIETSIDILKRKVKGIEEKIQIQLSKEEIKLKEKKDNIDVNITTNKEKLLNLKNMLSYYRENLLKTENKIVENEEEFKFLSLMQEELDKGIYECKYCGSTVKVKSQDAPIYKKLYKNIEINKDELEKLLKRKKELELEISYYEAEMLKIKNELNNDIQFKKENHNFYTKKSIEILKLEALRDEAINNISKLQKELKNNPKTNNKQFLTLTSNIEKYELSLNNLNKLKKIRENMDVEIKNSNILNKELEKITNTMEKFKKFLIIFYKIYEKKATEYCGNDFKFKIFYFEDYLLKDTFKIYYKNIEYNELPKKIKDEVDKILIEKFSIYL